MIALGELNSTAFDTEFRLPKVMRGEHMTVSAFDPCVRFPVPVATPRRWVRGFKLGEGAENNITITVARAKDFCLGDSSTEYASSHLENLISTAYLAYTTRIEELAAAAAQDGYRISLVSHLDFCRFLLSEPHLPER